MPLRIVKLVSKQLTHSSTATTNMHLLTHTFGPAQPRPVNHYAIQPMSRVRHAFLHSKGSVALDD